MAFQMAMQARNVIRALDRMTKTLLRTQLPAPASVSNKEAATIAELEQAIKRRRLEQELASFGPLNRIWSFVQNWKVWVLAFGVAFFVSPTKTEKYVTTAITEVAGATTRTAQEVVRKVEVSMKKWQLDMASNAGKNRQTNSPGGEGSDADTNVAIHSEQMKQLEEFLFADKTMSLFLVTGLRGSGKPWTVDNLIKKREDDRRKAAAANGHEEATANGHGGAAVFKVKLVGVSSVEDLVNAFAVALGVPSPGDDSTFKLFSSRVLGNEQGVSSDMKNLRHLLDLVENLAKEKRKPEQNPNSSSKTDKMVAKSARNNSPKNWDEERMVILIVDDMNAINFSENDRRLIDATSMMVQRFEDWARASLIRTVLVPSDHTIVDRVPRLHPSNPLIKPFAFNDLTKNEALDFLAERIDGARGLNTPPGRSRRASFGGRSAQCPLLR